MSLNLAAQHLASKGRHGDDSLVHVSKGELAGLQALAKSHGKNLTINPSTGLPEAFSLKSLLPMAAGAALVASGVGAPMAAAMVGGGMFAATGSLKQGLLAGLGAYGGAGLMGGVAGMGAEAGTQLAAGEAEAAAAQAAEAEAAKQTALQTAGQEAVTPQAIEKVAADQAARNAVGNQAVWEQSARDYASNAAGNTYELAGGYRPTFSPESVTSPGTVGSMTPSGTGFNAATQNALANPIQTGAKAAFSDPNAYIDKLGGGMQAAKYGLAAAAPGIVEDLTPKPYVPPEVKSDADMGQRYKYESGYDNSVPERTGSPSYTKISDEEARKLYGYAQGGVTRMAEGGATGASGYGAPAVQFSSGIDYSGYDTLPNQGITAISSTAAPNQNIIDLYKAIDAKKATTAKAAPKMWIATDNRLTDPNPEPYDGTETPVDTPVVDPWAVAKWNDKGARGGLMPRDLRYAEGGAADASGYGPSVGGDFSGYGPSSVGNYSGYGSPSVGNYSGYDTPVAAGLPAARQARASSVAAPTYGMVYDPTTQSYVGSAPSAGNVYKGGGQYGLDEESQKILDAIPSVVTDVIYDNGSGAAQGGLMHSYAAGGSTSLGSYSDGGRMLKGPGDGMSDNIPAVIGNKQPARLADGEFVVPADVVSHLGNGSTDAGAKQLYKMMDKIRQARTGRKAQGKQINPNKYMPA